MVDVPVRRALLVGAVLFACSRGESLTDDDMRPITTMPVSGTTSSSEGGESSESSTGTGTSTTELGTTTATPMTEATGGECPEGTPYCPCGGGCGVLLSCVDGLCQEPGCGNGVVEDGEECDDGDDDSSDECVTDCKAAVCGDGFMHVGIELCDDGLANSDTGRCKLNCTLQSCGDGLVGPGENCDDGNDENADACSNACAPMGCGDGMVAGSEQCDDMNAVNTDGCLNTCVLAVCGDGVVQEGVEACDDGDASNEDACVAGCAAAVCGDGMVQAGVEECDDGNVIATDGCDNQCARVSTLVGELRRARGAGVGRRPADVHVQGGVRADLRRDGGRLRVLDRRREHHRDGVPERLGRRAVLRHAAGRRLQGQHDLQLRRGRLRVLGVRGRPLRDRDQRQLLLEAVRLSRRRDRSAGPRRRWGRRRRPGGRRG
jgi:cysteine-rich repeat protein